MLLCWILTCYVSNRMEIILHPISTEVTIPSQVHNHHTIMTSVLKFVNEWNQSKTSLWDWNRCCKQMRQSASLFWAFKSNFRLALRQTADISNYQTKQEMQSKWHCFGHLFITSYFVISVFGNYLTVRVNQFSYFSLLNSERNCRASSN